MDRSPEELVDNAWGNIKSKSLTKTSGLVMTYLYDQPIIEYLQSDEQPHFLLRHDNKGFRITEPNGTEKTPDHDGGCPKYLLLTDQRILYIAGHEDGDKTMEFDYGDIVGFETSTGLSNARMTFTVKDGTDYSFVTAKDKSEIDGVSEFLSGRIEEREPDMDDEATQSGGEGTTRDGGGLGHIAEEHGDYVTLERVEKIGDVLDADEKVHYLTRGTTVDVEGSSAGSSLFGDDRSRKSGTRGYVRTGITNKRVVVKVPQWLGSDERSIPYQNITSVDLDTGLTYKRLTLQTPGQTYHIEAHSPDKPEIREAIRFIRNKITENQQNQVVEVGSDPDPTEQLQNIKELHDQGVLTDEEFEEKKQSLLDKI